MIIRLYNQMLRVKMVSENWQAKKKANILSAPSSIKLSFFSLSLLYNDLKVLNCSTQTAFQTSSKSLPSSAFSATFYAPNLKKQNKKKPVLISCKSRKRLIFNYLVDLE